MIEPPPLVHPPFDADDREMLLGFLDLYRATLVRKAAGLTKEQLARPLPPSTLTLGGLLKHMALVEDDWFTSDMAGENLPEPWASVDWGADRDWELNSAKDDTPPELLALFEAACARSCCCARCGVPGSRMNCNIYGSTRIISGRSSERACRSRFS